MGIFSSRRWMGLTPAICTVLCFMLSACNSTDEPIEEALSNAKPEMIHLSNGDVVVLSDTTTHTLDATEVDDVVMMSEKASEDLFGPVSRASTTGLRAYGFDCQEPETDWKTNHTCFSEECQSWIEGQIKTTISGPSTGFTGAKYTISNQIGQVEWTSSDASLATISNQGVLTVHGKGIVKIAASVNGVEYSKKIVVGMPTYVLSANHVPGGYMINANIISSQFKNYSSWINQVITFCWGVKYAGRDIKWVNGHSPSIMLPLEREADNATVYFKLIDNNGNESPMQFVNAVSSDLFFVNNNILSIDKSKNIYKENGSLYSYKNGKIYLTRDTSLPSQYQKDIWTSTKGVVFSPFSTAYDVTVTRGEIPIKQVLPEEELNLVIQNATTGKEYIYTIALLNPEDKIIQFIPVTFKMK